MADPDTQDSETKPPEGLTFYNRNARVMAEITASRLAELQAESAEIGTATAPTDDRDRDGEQDKPRNELEERAAERDGADGAGTGAAGTGDGDPAATPAAAADAPTADEMVDVVVDKRRLRVLKSEVDDAGGVEAFQKGKAADARLSHAGQLVRKVEDADTALRAKAAALGIDYETLQPLNPESKPAAADGTKPNGKGKSVAAQPFELDEETRGTIADTAKTIALAGDEEAVAESLTKLVQTVAGKTQPAQPAAVPDALIDQRIATGQERSRAGREWREFQEDNQDLVADPDAWEMTRSRARVRMVEELVEAGADPQAVGRLSDDQLGAFHFSARVAGKASSLRTVFDQAEGHVRKRLGLTKPAASSDDARGANGAKPNGNGSADGSTRPAPVGTIARREALKRGAVVATSTPASSSARADPAAPRIPSASEYIANMRKARGLPPSGPVT